jgi:hypothetical protein
LFYHTIGPAADGAPRQLTRLAEDMPCLAWSADAKRLLVQGEMGLYLVDPAAGTTRLLGEPPGWGVMDWRSGP